MEYLPEYQKALIRVVTSKQRHTLEVECSQKRTTDKAVILAEVERRRASAEAGKEQAKEHAEFCAYESVMIELEQLSTFIEKL
jgi:stress response protein SCP2